MAYSHTAVFEEWVSEFLDRIFVLLEMQVEASAQGFSEETMARKMVVGVAQKLFFQLSPELFTMALKKLFRFVSSRILLPSVKAFGLLCASATRVNPHQTLNLMLPHLAERIIDMAALHTRAEEQTTEVEHADGELRWCLGILSRLVKWGGEALLTHAEALVEVLAATLPLSAKSVSKEAGKLFRQTLRALTEYHTRDASSVAPSVRAQCAEDPIALFQCRGVPESGPYGNGVEVVWHCPSSEEVAFGEALLEQFYDPAVTFMEDLARADASVVAAVNPVVLRVNLMIIRNAARAGLLLFPESEVGGCVLAPMRGGGWVVP